MRKVWIIKITARERLLIFLDSSTSKNFCFWCLMLVYRELVFWTSVIFSLSHGRTQESKFVKHKKSCNPVL